MNKILKYSFVVIVGVLGTMLTGGLLVPVNLFIAGSLVSHQNSWKILYFFLFLQFTGTFVSIILWIKFSFYIFNKMIRGDRLYE